MNDPTGIEDEDIPTSMEEAPDGVRGRKPARTRGIRQKKKAGDGIRTHDSLLGKQILYH